MNNCKKWFMRNWIYIILFASVILYLSPFILKFGLNPFRLESYSDNPYDWGNVSSFISPIFSTLSILVVFISIKISNKHSIDREEKIERINRLDELLKMTSSFFTKDLMIDHRLFLPEAERKKELEIFLKEKQIKYKDLINQDATSKDKTELDKQIYSINYELSSISLSMAVDCENSNNSMQNITSYIDLHFSTIEGFKIISISNYINTYYQHIRALEFEEIGIKGGSFLISDYKLTCNKLNGYITDCIKRMKNQEQLNHITEKTSKEMQNILRDIFFEISEKFDNSTSLKIHDYYKELYKKNKKNSFDNIGDYFAEEI